MPKENFNLQMSDLFPPLFGDSHHQQHAAPDSRHYVQSSMNDSYFASSTSLPFGLNEQYVEKDLNHRGNTGLFENRDGIAENNCGYRGNYQGFVVENHYSDDVVKIGCPKGHIEENNYPDQPIEENDLGVLPCQSGEGLPYAPVDWPNPGDNWSWRVGKRFNSSFHFADRFLYPPKRLRNASYGPCRFASKPAVTKYVLSLFPDANIDAFFASFTWKIPVNLQFARKVQAIPELNQVDAVNKVLEQTPNATLRKRRRKSSNQEETGEYLPASGERKRKKNKARHEEETSQYSTGWNIDHMEAGLEEFGEIGYSSQRKSSQKTATWPLNEQQSSKKGNRVSKSRCKQKTRFSSLFHPFSSGRNVVYVEEEDDDPPDEFDKYLNNLENMVSQPVEYNSINVVPFYEEDEMVEARSRLSSLLTMDFPSLVTPTIITELTTLASKLQRDPTMSADQLVKLKLIEDISSYAEVFLESREIIEEVNNLFEGLDAKKQKVYSLKNEYKELKGKAREHQININSATSAIEQIDYQIVKLQSRRRDVTKRMDNKNAAKTEVTTAQKMVAAEIPNVVREIQVANSKMAEWKLKKTNAAIRKEEIIAKFAVLKGFTL